MLELIKELRERTGAGMIDCKKALEASGRDMEKAIEYLRKQGIAKAAKRAGRAASEGLIKLAVRDGGRAAFMIEVNAETDFVARNEKFRAFAEEALAVLERSGKDTLGDFLREKMSEGTVEETLAALSGTIGEKMAVKDIALIRTKGTAAAYSHLGGKIGVILSLDKPGEDELALNMAMQVAAANPKYLESGAVPAEETEKEKEIYREQLKKEGKPENIIDKILAGKIGKYYEEVCLLDQEYIKDDKKKVKDVLGDVKVEKFARFCLN